MSKPSLSSLDFSVQPVYSLSFKEDTQNTLHSEDLVSRLPVQRVGTADLIKTIVTNSIPIFAKNPVEVTSLRDFGGGGTYVVSHAELEHNLNPADFTIGQPSRVRKSYAKGSSVVIKVLNPLELSDGNKREIDYSAISTELTILSYPAIIQSPWIVDAIGIGWDASPYETPEAVRYYPYLVTESGDLGNLEEFFRIESRKLTIVPETKILNEEENARDWLERRQLENLGSLQRPEGVSQMPAIPWELKVFIALSVARALRDLHHCGVVHGDVKMTNVVVGEIQSDRQQRLLFKLCDFGSSPILSDYTDMNPPRCKLQSMTFPWEAPEVRSSLSPEEAVKTDVYSYGLLFARIFLQGNCPFDDSFDIRYDAVPKLNPDHVKMLKGGDKIVPHILSRLKSTMIYTNEQLAVFESILAATLAKDPKDRIGCLTPVIEVLEEIAGKNDRDTSELSTALSSLCLETRSLTPVVHPKYRCSHCLPSTTNMVKRCVGIPNIAQTIYRDLFANYGVLQEVLFDLESLASDEHNKDQADAQYEAAMLHLHGLGTKQCLETALKWLELSALAGSLKAKLVLLQVLSAIEVPLTDDLSSILDDVIEAYPQANQRKIAEAISVLKPEAFERAVERARWSHLDLLTRTTRHELVSIMIEGRRIIALNIKSGETILPLQDWLTPLQREVLFGEVQEVRRLVREDCNVDEARIANHSALWLACNCGFTDMAMALLEASASPNIADSLEGYSALHFLARFPPNEIPEIARTLVASGAGLESRTNQDETPLLTVLDDERNFMPFACSPAVDVLLSLGASPYGNLKESHVLGDLRVPWPDCPLSRACTINADAVIALLERIKILRSVDQAVDGSPPSQSSETRMEPESSQTSQREYMTALMAGCFRLAVTKPTIYRLSRGRGYKGSLSRLVKYLLDEDVRSHLSKLLGMPALLHCCQCLAYDFCETILEQKLYSAAELADTRLILLASATRNPNLVRQLITAGASLSIVNDDGLTFLHHAVKHRWCVADLSEICDLVSDAIDLHDLAKRRDSGGATPFDYAVQQGSLQLADFLARFGVEVDVCAFRLSHSTRAPFGWPLCTLLGYCLATTEDDILRLQQIRYLLKYSPKFRVSPSHGCTALTLCWTPWKQQRKRYISPELGTVFSTQLLDLLLRHYSGPDFINQTDYLGATPLHWAATAGNLIGVQRLLEVGAEINVLENGCLTPIDCAGDVLFVLSELSLSKSPQPAKLAAINGHVVDASIEYYIYLQVIGFLESRGALPGVECLAQGMKKPARGPECRLAEDQHRARRRLEDRVETKLARNRGATHTFLVNPPTERNDLGYMPAGLIVDTSDNSDESTDGDDDDDHSSGAQLKTLNQVVEESTACRATAIDESDVEQQPDEDSVPVRIQDILDSPRHRRKVRTRLLARAGNALRRLGFLNESGEWVGELGAVTERLATHPKTGTKIRRLLAQVLAELSADALGGVPEDIATSVALRLECRYLEDLNDEEESVPICLHVIFKELKRRT